MYLNLMLTFCIVYEAPNNVLQVHVQRPEPYVAHSPGLCQLGGVIKEDHMQVGRDSKFWRGLQALDFNCGMLSSRGERSRW